MKAKKETRPARILLVDDVPGVRDTLRYMMERRFSCDITSAGTAEEVIDRLERAKRDKEMFDLIVLDLEMPVDGPGGQKLSSVGLLLLENKDIRRRYLTNGPDIIVFTQFSSQMFKRRVKSSGEYPFITKHNSGGGGACTNYTEVVDIALAKLSRRIAL